MGTYLITHIMRPTCKLALTNPPDLPTSGARKSRSALVLILSIIGATQVSVPGMSGLPRFASPCQNTRSAARDNFRQLNSRILESWQGTPQVRSIMMQLMKVFGHANTISQYCQSVSFSDHDLDAPPALMVGFISPLSPL